MKNQYLLRRVAGVYGGIALALALLSSVLRCVNLKFFYDVEIGYFQSGAPLPMVAGVILTASVLFFAVAAFLLFRGSKLAPPKTDSLPLRVASGIVAVAFLYVAALNILGLSGSVWSGILSLGAGLYFTTVISKKPLPPLFRLFCAVCAVARLFLAMATAYRDVTVQMNAPLKLTLQIACVAGMLIVVSDLRAKLSRARPILYPFSLAFGALFTAVYAIPCLINAKQIGEPSADAYVLLALFLFAAVRLLELGRASTPEEDVIETEYTMDMEYFDPTEEDAQPETTESVEASAEEPEPAEASEQSNQSPEQEG